jgi:hypothetical protein
VKERERRMTRMMIGRTKEIYGKTIKKNERNELSYERH